MSTGQPSAVQGFPLSALQRASWRARQVDPSRAGTTRVVVRVAAPLNETAVRDALSRLTARHEILRTTFRRPAGVQLPLQVIDDAIAPTLRFVAATADELERALADDASTPLDLEAGPLVRVTVLTLSRTEHVVSVHGSCLVVDVPSALAIVRAVSDAATAAAGDDAPQYADLAAWQDDVLLDSAPESDAARAHWKDLQDVERTRVPGETAASAHGSRIRHRIAVPDGRALEELAARLSVTGDDVLIAGWFALLARLSGQETVVAGFASDGRAYEELRGALGPLAKTLPVVVSFDGDPTFASFVRRVRDSVDAALAAQDQWVPADHSAASASGTTVAVATAGGDAATGASTIEVAETDDDTAPVRLVADARGSAPSAVIDFDASAVSRAAARELADSFGAFLESVLAAPNHGIRSAALVTAPQRARLEAMFDATATPLSQPAAPVVDLVGAHVARAPGATAIVAGGVALTYADLWRRAQVVARRLADAGVRRDDVVGICVSRSVDAPVAMLGVMLAGAAFLPIDPAYPADRRAFMLVDAKARAIVAGSEFADAVSSHRIPVVSAAVQDEQAETTGERGSAAYVIYTSGTTGTPRGVVVRQTSLSHYVVAIGDALGVGPDDVYLHTASIGFSSTVRQLLMPLTRGASVVIASEDERRDPLMLFESVRERGVTIIDLVPSYLRTATTVLRAAADATRARLLDNDLRLIASASEALHSDLPRAWRDEFGFRGRMVNMYGLTESTGIAATYEIGDIATDSAVRVVPIGSPIAGLRLSVVDESLALVPLGAVGELLVAGRTVRNEFMNDPGRTAERFVATAPGEANAFRTGDRVRAREDGTIEYVGRGDDVVKVRGVRIALGEVEVALARHPGVRSAAAAVHGGSAATLIGYVVREAGATVSESELRQFLSATVPAHLVPDLIVLLDALPLTPNGKLDRKALPAPDVRRATAAAHVAPRDVLEDALSGVWAEVLGVERVGVEDDFFDLGGHSLLATQLVARVRETFQSDITLRSLFESRTVAQQAAVLRGAERPGVPLDKIAAIVVQLRDMTPDAARELLAQRGT